MNNVLLKCKDQCCKRLLSKCHRLYSRQIHTSLLSVVQKISGRGLGRNNFIVLLREEKQPRQRYFERPRHCSRLKVVVQTFLFRDLFGSQNNYEKLVITFVFLARMILYCCRRVKNKKLKQGNRGPVVAGNLLTRAHQKNFQDFFCFLLNS